MDGNDLLESLRNQLAALENRPPPKAGQCPLCGKDGPFKFKDEISRKDYEITGCCQECQDKTYSGAED